MNAAQSESEFPRLPRSVEELTRLRNTINGAIIAFRILEGEFRAKSSYLELPPKERRNAPDPWDTIPAMNEAAIGILVSRFDFVRDHMSTEMASVFDMAFEIIRRFNERFGKAMRRKRIPARRSTEYAKGVRRIADTTATAFQVLKTFEKRVVQHLAQVQSVVPAKGSNISSSRSSSGKVMLGNRAEQPIVQGKKKPQLTIAQYDVVTALLAAGERGLSKDQLAKKSKHGGARGVLGRLAESDMDWKDVIEFPRRTGGGYRIR